MPVTTDKRPLNVFLCYTHIDKDAVKRLHDLLVNDGVDVWMDKEKLFGGSNWEYEIRKAVRDCDIFVVCVSAQFTKRFNLKYFSQTEVGIALNEAALKPKEEIFIVPVRLEDCKVPKSLGPWHWVDLFESNGYQKLIRSLNRRIEQLSELGWEQTGYSKISIVVGGNVQGNIVIGNNNVTQFNSEADANIADTKALQEAEEFTRIEKEHKTAELTAPEKEKRQAAQKAEHEKVEKAALEKKEYEAAEQARREEVERETAERIAREKEELEAAAKLAQEKIEKGYQHKREKIIRDARRQKILIDIRYSLSLIRIYALPIIFALIAIAALIFLVFYLQENIPRLTQALSATPQPSHISTEAFVSTEIFTPSSTPNENVVVTATLLPAEITDAKGVQMVLVPAGEFIMGDDSTGYLDRDADQNPTHDVYLASFYMDMYEVTNFLYQNCVDSGVCTKPRYSSSNTRSHYYGNPEFNNYPVLFVDWYQATNYCEWRGARLPTEAEWEKAARGTDGRDYPWKSQLLVEDAANHSSSTNTQFGDTTEVGSYPLGISSYGIYDMAGNVWEWVNDWYQSNYYTIHGDGAVNPQGPENGESKVLRGGSWFSGGWVEGAPRLDSSIGTFNRHRDYPSRFYFDYGFRCAKDATP
jgi:formylglycine-generating enzyme required for sulfatase activity